MRLATPKQISKIEKRIISEFGISEEILMENAGLLAAKEIVTSYMPEIQRGRLAILCGPGHNGGDGLVVARHLANLGVTSLSVINFGEGRSPLREKQQFRAANQKITIINFKKKEDLQGFDLYVDGLFGVGLNRDLEEPYISAISFLNGQSKPVIALDVPTGVDSESGKILGSALKCQLTLTMGVGKPGLFISPGCDYVGKLRILPLGFPRSVLKEEAQTHFFINDRWARRWLPVRDKDSNKFKNGKLAIKAGHAGTWGAAALCCQGAYRAGAGYVTLVLSDAEDAKKYLGHELGPEVLLASESDRNVFEKASAFIVGPGAGITKNTKDFILKLVEERKDKVLIDADGLSCLSEMKDIKIPSSWILTPHSGELARLMKKSAAEIDKDRVQSAQNAAKIWNCNVLLKGYRSILATPQGVTYFIGSGNASLAKAGTGDVLSGFIGAFLGQGLESVPAATTGAYVHGSIADTWVKQGGNILTLNASDLPRLVSDEFNRLGRS